MKFAFVFAVVISLPTFAPAQDYNYSIPLGFGDLTATNACAPGSVTSGGGFCILEPVFGGETSGGGITRLLGSADLAELQQILSSLDLPGYQGVNFAEFTGVSSISPTGCAAVMLQEGCTCSDAPGGRPIVNCAGAGIMIDGLVGFPKEIGTVLPNILIVAATGN